MVQRTLSSDSGLVQWVSLKINAEEFAQDTNDALIVPYGSRFVLARGVAR